MTYCDSWEEFGNAAEQLYLNDPSKVSILCKYSYTYFYNYILIKTTKVEIIKLYKIKLINNLIKTNTYENLYNILSMIANNVELYIET